MTVPLRGFGLGRFAWHGRGPGRHDDRRVGMMLGDGHENPVLIVCAIACEGRHGPWHLIEQGANLGAIVDLLRGQRCCDDLPVVGIQADVQLAPGPARLGTMFLDQPLARATQAQAGAVHQQVQRLAVTTRLWPWHRQRSCPAAKRAMVGHCQIEPKQADDGAEQAFGLAQRQAEHGPEHQRCQDRQRRIPGLPARGRARLRSPARDGFVREPDRQAAALAQAGVIGRRVHHLVLLLGNVVTVVLVQLERQSGCPGQVWRNLLRRAGSSRHWTSPCNKVARAEAADGRAERGAQGLAVCFAWVRHGQRQRVHERDGAGLLPRDRRRVGSVKPHAIDDADLKGGCGGHAVRGASSAMPVLRRKRLRRREAGTCWL